MPSYQKLQCRLAAPYILVACNGRLQRKKINTDDHLSMCSCSGGTALDKAVKFRISWSGWCTFSRGEQIRGYVPRENEHRGAHFRGWCTNSLANLCAGARLRGGNEYAVTPASSTVNVNSRFSRFQFSAFWWNGLASGVFIFAPILLRFFFIFFVYARAKIRCYRFFNFDLRKKLCFIKADRVG